MINTPIKNTEMGKAFDACTPFLTIVERAIEEAEENVRKLRSVRSLVKNEMLGENKVGVQKAMDEAGMNLTGEEKV